MCLSGIQNRVMLIGGLNYILQTEPAIYLLGALEMGDTFHSGTRSRFYYLVMLGLSK